MSIQSVLPETAIPDDATLQAVEETAVLAARKAGEFVAERFGGPLEVMQKAVREGVDIVTDADKAAQELIVSIIHDKFPDHMVLGEEDPPDTEPPAPDFIWAVDPIDGTKNFVNGSPVHAVSVGVLYRGAAVAGAIWTPWPSAAGFTIAHARSGNGAWMNGAKLDVSTADGDSDGVPNAGRLTAIPGGLNWTYDIKKPLRGNLGEVRITGSVCYEMLMVATGSMQYAISGFANVWDYAAGIAIVREAGGITLTPQSSSNWRGLSGWSDLFNGDAETSKRLRAWKGPVLSGPPALARFVASNLGLKQPGLLKRVWKSVKS